MFTTEIQAKRLYVLYQNEIVCIINDIHNPRRTPSLMIPNSLDLELFNNLVNYIETITKQHNLC